ncbi:hypothetical protein DPMN_076691 [Dreissena polymorpha]|uniref:Uncharacterized protein n=1 Tax=Dreissena polymorpha TaxID=45954 RepID=A0A9D3YJ64_DREPO|nr:hypothetical protein DPMN_076691 [Dreissena polymorpha]
MRPSSSDKAHSYRDRRSRDIDIVRRFLDGLSDDGLNLKLSSIRTQGTLTRWSITQLFTFRYGSPLGVNGGTNTMLGE